MIEAAGLKPLAPLLAEISWIKITQKLYESSRSRHLLNALNHEVDALCQVRVH
ncbi:MAG: hypothetical protein L0220_09910 [Acidobacteria bacterium]|nr:hypothetical protein [Acidobacteriota bacterium]